MPAAGAVTLALTVYAAAALALDQVTLLMGLAGSGPVVARAVATYLEEGAGAVTALVLLAVVAR